MGEVRTNPDVGRMEPEASVAPDGVAREDRSPGAAPTASAPRSGAFAHLVEECAPPLASMIMPQLDQFAMTRRRHGCGWRFETAGAAPGRGTLVAVQVTPTCLFYAHELIINTTFDLYEHPRADYAALCSISRASLTAPIVPPNCVMPRAILPDENIVAFEAPAGETVSTLAAGERHASSGICLLPGFFRELDDAYPGEFSGLYGSLGTLALDAVAPELRAVLRSLRLADIRRPASALMVKAKVLEAVSLLGRFAHEEHVAQERHGERPQTELVERACSIIASELADPPTIDELAGRLYVGRTRLCAAFKQETGRSVGAWARGVRLERAKELLAAGGMPVADVARACGYASAASFTEAFHAAVGTAPGAWARDQR